MQLSTMLQSIISIVGLVVWLGLMAMFADGPGNRGSIGDQSQVESYQKLKK